MKTRVFSLFLMCLVFQNFVFGQAKDMVLIEGSRYLPLYGRDSTVVEVKDFKMDVYPVSVEDYMTFLKENPKWRKSNIKGLFADKSYLANWQSDLKMDDSVIPNSPITNVSWFAAKAYCECQDKRLPTVDEWEYVAMQTKQQKMQGLNLSITLEF